MRIACNTVAAPLTGFLRAGAFGFFSHCVFCHASILHHLSHAPRDAGYHFLDKSAQAQTTLPTMARRPRDHNNAVSKYYTRRTA
jgi:hypothetical protein